MQFQRMANMRARLAGDHEVQPGRVWPSARGADNFHRRAAFQGLRQRCQAAVDAAGNAGIADVGVHRVGEVDRRGAFRQLHDAALGREHVDLVREQVDLHALDKFQRVAGALLHFQHAFDPLPRAGVAALGQVFLVGFVQPVRGDAVVGQLFHFAGTDLDLDRYAVHAEQRGVQRLVAVGLGYRDVVLEAAGQGLVQVVHGAQYAVTGVDLVDDDAEGVDVHDFVERPALAAHFLVDAVEVLLAARHLAFHAFASQAMEDRFFDLVDDFLAVAPSALDRCADALGAHRVHGFEAQVFELDAHAVHAQAVGNWRVDFQGFLGDAPALFAGQHLQGAHVVQTIGQLDQDHADVAGHGHGHLLEVFRLRLGLGFEVHLGQFADPVDQLGHGFAKLGVQCFLGDAGVFDHVMQHRSHQALMVHVHVCQDARHSQRVGDVGFAAAAALAVVGLFGVEVGAADQVNLVVVEVGRKSAGEDVYARHGYSPCRFR